MMIITEYMDGGSLDRFLKVSGLQRTVYSGTSRKRALLVSDGRLREFNEVAWKLALSHSQYQIPRPF